MSIDVHMGTCFSEIIWGEGELLYFPYQKKLKHTLKRNEILTDGTTWMNPEDTLGKINTKGQMLYDSTWYDITDQEKANS